MREKSRDETHLRVDKVLLLPPHFPDGKVGLFDEGANVVDQIAHHQPVIVRDGLAHLLSEVDGVEKLSVNVELEVVCRR
jgi:hypothetical protein